LWAALAFAVLTDVIAALVMGAISWKSSLETFIIALFVIAGVRIASLITAKVF
jgi:high-affinity Fe2+/Pb2+ permease